MTVWGGVGAEYHTIGAHIGPGVVSADPCWLEDWAEAKTRMEAGQRNPAHRAWSKEIGRTPPHFAVLSSPRWATWRAEVENAWWQGVSPQAHLARITV
jgi:hypothetical protein